VLDAKYFADPILRLDAVDIEHNDIAGKLRIGLHSGTPTSIIGNPVSGNTKGVRFELGRELA